MLSHNRRELNPDLDNCHDAEHMNHDARLQSLRGRYKYVTLRSTGNTKGAHETTMINSKDAGSSYKCITLRRTGNTKRAHLHRK